MADAIKRYLDHLRVDRRLSPRTLTLYQEGLTKLHVWARGKDWGALMARDMRQWVTQMHQKGMRPRSIALVLSIWRGFFRWLLKNGLVAVNPVEGVRPPKAGKPLPKALGVDDAVHLASFSLHAPPNRPSSGPLQVRDAAIVELLYGCGLRVSELTSLNIDAQDPQAGWVDMQECLVHVKGKGNKRRIVPIGAAACRAVQAWLVLRSQNPVLAHSSALFTGRHGTRLTVQSIWLRLKTLGNKAGLDVHVHPHMLRHSYASHILQSSGDLRGVQELLGHASISSTQVYTRLDFQHLAHTYDQTHPRAKLKSEAPASGPKAS